MMKYFKNTSIVMLCVIAIVAKLVIVGGNLADAIALVGLCGYLGYQNYIDIARDNAIQKINTQISAISDEYKKLHSEISSIKAKHTLDQNTRKMNASRPQQQKEKRYF